MSNRLLNQQQYKRENADTPDPNALIPIKDFIRYVEAVERAFLSDKPTDILTRIRVQYYSGFLFEQLIPDAHTHDTLHGFNDYYQSEARTLSSGKVDATAMKHLTARADENSWRAAQPSYGDNPSPYVVMPDRTRIDVGHLFLGMDALLHPRTNIPYSTYQIPNIDPASWVADLGFASFWMSHHVEKGSPHSDAPLKLKAAVLSDYIRMSAPTEDLLGDVDSFGATQQFNSMPGQKLSVALRAYYLGTNGKEPGINRRWQIFCDMNGLCYGHKRSGTTVTAINWDSTIKSTLIKRIDRFNDLAAAGKLGAIGGTIFKPSRRTWPYTPKVVDWFLSFVEKGLKAEIGNTLKASGQISGRA